MGLADRDYVKDLHALLRVSRHVPDDDLRYAYEQAMSAATRSGDLVRARTLLSAYEQWSRQRGAGVFGRTFTIPNAPHRHARASRQVCAPARTSPAEVGHVAAQSRAVRADRRTRRSSDGPPVDHPSADCHARQTRSVVAPRSPVAANCSSSSSTAATASNSRAPITAPTESPSWQEAARRPNTTAGRARSASCVGDRVRAGGPHSGPTACT